MLILAVILLSGMLISMAFASARELFLDQAKHTASVLTLSFAGINVHEAPKPNGDFKGNFIGESKDTLVYLGQPVSLYFNTGQRISLKGGNTLSFRPRAIEWTHAQLAPKVWTRLPKLLPIIHLKLKERQIEFTDEVLMARELENPCVVFDSSASEPTDEWSFEVEQPSYDFGHYVKFRGFDLIESYTVG